MSPIGIVARKEFRGYFQSLVALIFLAVFLAATLFSFFGSSGFFIRNIADVRPLFQWLPLLLIFLVAAIAMRQWAEERKMGTLEILATLPLSTRDMVLGKFLAGVGLIGLALALTLPLPLMVSQMGDLDWGPVVGGYLGALLLGATYLSIGLCVSARTDNQVVALMLTLVICGASYLIGSDQLTVLFGSGGSELLRGLGTGSRFASIERGVLELRDLVYYGGLVVFFLSLNWLFLEEERIDSGSGAGRAQARKLRLLVGLVGLNVVALNVWLAPITALRVDMTERGEYSISRTTKQTLASLDEPLVIAGYFSERIHPLLSPLVPQIRDLLAEYAIYGGPKVSVEFADPNADEELEQLINEQFGIRSVPFRVVDRHQQAVVNSYFHVLVRYGDQHETLSFDQLIEVRLDGNDIDVRLRNLEYDLTRTIRRVSQEFQGMESVFGRLPAAKLTAYLTPETLPEAFSELPERLRKVAGELQETSGGKLVFEQVNPEGDPELQERLESEYGIRPLAVDPFGRRSFYLDLVLEAGDKAQRIIPRSDPSEGELRSSLEAAIRRTTPGQLKTVGILTETPVAPPPNPQIPPQYQPPPPQPDYRFLQQMLREEYEVEKLDLSDGIVPDVIDVLLVGKPGSLSAHEQFALDQYLMRGGKVIALAGRHAIRASQQGLEAVRHETPLFEMLETWGVTAEPALVMDLQNAPFPIPVQEQRGPFRFQRIKLVPYPFFADIRQDGFLADHPALGGLQNTIAPWASPLVLNPAEGVESDVLLRTSPQSWLNQTGSIDPDFRLYPKTGFGTGSEMESRVVGVALTGTFPSYFADRPSPLFEDKEFEDREFEDKEIEASGGEEPELPSDGTGRTMKRSLPDARLVVLGSAELVSDLILQISEQLGGEVHQGNLQLLQNLVDWSVEDTDLLAIRSTGAFARTLRPMPEGEPRVWEVAAYGVVLVLLLAVVFVPRWRRRIEPIPVASREVSS
jgi:ABC-2 type transport system permease protein